MITMHTLMGMGTSMSLGCTFCGRRFDSANVISLLDCLVCAGCKPAAVQRLREGSSLLPDDFPRLSFSAVDPKGKQVTEKVAAASASAARDVLLHRGYTGVVLHADDAPWKRNLNRPALNPQSAKQVR